MSRQLHSRAMLLVLVLAFLVVGKPAGASVVIDFESLQHADDLVTVHGPEYVEDGFRLIATHPEPGNPLRINTLGTMHFGFNGSTSAYNGVSNGEITLLRADGLSFDLLSIELTELPGGEFDDAGELRPVNLGPFGVTFSGQRLDGSTIIQTFTVDNFLTPTTYAFSGFTGLVAVRWSQGAGGPTSPGHQFDNIIVAPVPEPMSIFAWSLVVFSMSVTFLTRRGIKAAVPQ